LIRGESLDDKKPRPERAGRGFLCLRPEPVVGPLPQPLDAPWKGVLNKHCAASLWDPACRVEPGLGPLSRPLDAPWKRGLNKHCAASLRGAACRVEPRLGPLSRPLDAPWKDASRYKPLGEAPLDAPWKRVLKKHCAASLRGAACRVEPRLGPLSRPLDAPWKDASRYKPLREAPLDAPWKRALQKHCAASLWGAACRAKPGLGPLSRPLDAPWKDASHCHVDFFNSLWKDASHTQSEVL
jgi:hypothetical protein